jgi:hypothetical protein
MSGNLIGIRKVFGSVHSIIRQPRDIEIVVAGADIVPTELPKPTLFAFILTR